MFHGPQIEKKMSQRAAVVVKKKQKFHVLQSNFDYFLNFDSNAGRMFEAPALK
jgi:hypothetical protein